MKAKIRSLVLLCTTLGLVGCDHATKLAATSWLPHNPVSLVAGWVELRYAENRDIAFSLTRAWGGAAKPFLLVGVGVLMIGGLLRWAWQRRRQATWMEQLGVSAIVAGALGNLIDRVARGFVVDFIYVHHYSVFNVADVLIAVGVAGMLLGMRAPPAPEPV